MEGGTQNGKAVKYLDIGMLNSDNLLCWHGNIQNENDVTYIAL